MKNLFYPYEKDPFADNIILIGQILLFVTVCLLISSYLYYQLKSRYSEIEYCFGMQCFVITSSVHINPQDIQEPPYTPTVLPLLGRKTHHQHQAYLSNLCADDVKCNPENYLHQLKEVQGNKVLDFIPVTHDVRTEIFLLKTKKRWLKKAIATITNLLKQPSATINKHMTLKLTEQGFPIICGEISDDVNTLINYQSFVYLAETDTAILLDKEHNKSQQISNAWQEHCF